VTPLAKLLEAALFASPRPLGPDELLGFAFALGLECGVHGTGKLVPFRSGNMAHLQRELGVELRGGERFLSITSTAAASLAGARLLREGDAEGGWQLQSIEAQAGVFQVNGQTQRVAVP